MGHEVQFSRRERQIMDVIYARGAATAAEVLAGIASPPTRTSVRTLLRILEDKGHLTHTKRGREFLYHPTRPRGQAGQSAMQRVVSTFFDGSLCGAVAAHLGDPSARPSEEELSRLEDLIRKARDEEPET